MGMKKKVLSATLCAVMVGSLAVPAFTVQEADEFVSIMQDAAK